MFSSSQIYFELYFNAEVPFIIQAVDIVKLEVLFLGHFGMCDQYKLVAGNIEIKVFENMLSWSL